MMLIMNGVKTEAIKPTFQAESLNNDQAKFDKDTAKLKNDHM